LLPNRFFNLVVPATLWGSYFNATTTREPHGDEKVVSSHRFCGLVYKPAALGIYHLASRFMTLSHVDSVVGNIDVFNAIAVVDEVAINY
jgi:hypothetical protein